MPVSEPTPVAPSVGWRHGLVANRVGRTAAHAWFYNTTDVRVSPAPQATPPG